MSETKLNVYLDKYQYHKLCAVAASLQKSPEEVAQNVLIGYLAIVEPDPIGAVIDAEGK